ncbi:MAG: gliding motility-associated C-terminal domain-containing protein [Phaeodactylibacter sp.]|uniref:T9SS type B sorting domain-containing protein n=1 Tax=Phaeodactylibacter sp. TaxID=1940289 RepID=UPI0032EF9015
MKAPLLIFLTLFCTSLVFGQSEITVLGTDRPETGQRIIWHNNAFYLLLQVQAEIGGENAVLLKLDASGSMLWARAVGTPGRDLVNDLAPQQDGVLVLGRMVEPGNPNVIDDVFLHFFEADGSIGWSRYLGRTTGGDDEHAAAVFTTDAGNIVVVMHEAVGQDRPAYLTLLQDNGSPIWGTQLRHEDLDWIMPAHGLEHAGRFWIAGTASLADGTEEAFWATLNTAGQPLSWYSMAATDNQPCSFRQMIALEDGCLLVGTIGTDTPDLLLVWADQSGEQVRARRFRDVEGAHLLAATGGYQRADGRIVVAANRFEATGGVSSTGLWLLIEEDGTLAECRRVGQGREVIVQLIPGPAGMIAATGSTFPGSSTAGDATFLQWPENWWEAPENCLSAPLLPEPAALAWNSRTSGAFTQPWLAEANHQMVDVPYFLDEKRPLCCPEKDTLYASICTGDAFEGFSRAGTHRYQIDSIGLCGLERLLVLEVKDTAQLQGADIQPSDCDQPNGTIRVEAEGDSLQFSLSGGPFQDIPQFEALPPGFYTLVAKNANGCVSAVDSVVVAADCPVYLPTAFSPNGDGRNDVLQLYTPLAESAAVISFQVFDRYGGLLYEASGPLSAVQWDGRVNGELVNPGVYTCIGRVRLPIRDVEIFQSVTVVR